MTSAPTRHDRRLSHRRISLPAAALAAVLAAALALLIQHLATHSSSTVEGSGLATTQARVVPRFDAIELAGSTRSPSRSASTPSWPGAAGFS